MTLAGAGIAVCVAELTTCGALGALGANVGVLENRLPFPCISSILIFVFVFGIFMAFVGFCGVFDRGDIEFHLDGDTQSLHVICRKNRREVPFLRIIKADVCRTGRNRISVLRFVLCNPDDAIVSHNSKGLPVTELWAIAEKINRFMCKYIGLPV